MKICEKFSEQMIRVLGLKIERFFIEQNIATGNDNID